MHQARWLPPVNVVWALVNLSLSLALLFLPARYPHFVVRYAPWLAAVAVIFQIISIFIWFHLG
jgi:hypothetical protein